MGYSLPDPRMENPGLFLPGKKPIGAVVVDEQHPLARDLTSFNLMRSDNDDVVTQRRLIRDNPSFAYHGIQAGEPVLVINPTSTQSKVTADKRVLRDGAAHTMLCCVAMSLLNGTGVNGFYTENDATGHHILRMLSATSFEFLINGLTNDRVNHSFNPSNNVPFVAGGSWAGSGTPLNVITHDQTNGLKRTVNGAASTGTFQAGNPTYSSADGWFGSSVGYYHWFACWERVLSDAEISAFIRNPYQILVPA